MSEKNNYVAITDGACAFTPYMQCSVAIYETDKIYDRYNIQEIRREAPIYKSIRNTILAYDKLLIPLIAEVTAVHVLLSQMYYMKLLHSDTRLTIYSDCLPMIEHFSGIKRPNNYKIKGVLDDINWYIYKIRSTGFDFSTMGKFVYIPGEVMKLDTVIQH